MTFNLDRLVNLNIICMVLNYKYKLLKQKFYFELHALHNT